MMKIPGRTVREIMILLLLSLIPASGTFIYLLRHPPVVEGVKAVTLLECQSKGSTVIWVDARRVEEYQAAHIPGALNLNEDMWSQQLSAVLQEWAPDKTVVVYCGSSRCQSSEQVARRLMREAGFENVRILRGGWEEGKGQVSP